MSELEALEYVAEHTTIAIPKELNSYRVDGKAYIEMEYIRGECLDSAWASGSVTGTEKRTIMNQLRSYIEQLRSLNPPPTSKEGGLVASTKGGQLLDARIGCFPFGPYNSHAAFQSFLRGHIDLDTPSQMSTDTVKYCHSHQYRTCFSHADIAPRNFIVRDGVLVMMDWGFAGWYTEYWDYTKAHYGAFPSPDWYEMLREAFPVRYDEELEAERVLWRCFDEPGMYEHTWFTDAKGNTWKECKI